MPPALVDDLAASLAQALDPGGTWYADFGDARTHTVVFPGRVFRYEVADHDGRARAIEHGRHIGIPESQLDWGE